MNISETAEELDQTDRRQALLDSLGKLYRLEPRELRFGAATLRLTAIADPDSLLNDDRILAASHDELPWHPYWVHAGAAATALAAVILQAEMEGLDVLDLGCGLGLTALAAAQSGAQVVACDHAPPAVQFTELNTFDFRERVLARQFDWRFDRLESSFDFIVGSDVLYNRADVPHLEKIWNQALKPAGRIWLGDPNRPLTADLLRDLENRGWRVETKLTETEDGTARISELSRPNSG